MNYSQEGNPTSQYKVLLTKLYGSHKAIFFSVSTFLRKLHIEVGLSRVQMLLFQEVVHIISHFEYEKFQ